MAARLWVAFVGLIIVMSVRKKQRLETPWCDCLRAWRWLKTDVSAYRWRIRELSGIFSALTVVQLLPQVNCFCAITLACICEPILDGTRLRPHFLHKRIEIHFSCPSASISSQSIFKFAPSVANHIFHIRLRNLPRGLSNTNGWGNSCSNLCFGHTTGFGLSLNHNLCHGRGDKNC
jgi:hypothetical protein